MRLAPSHVAVLTFAFLGAGCTDSFPKIVQNELTLFNEFADNLMKVVDEDTAKTFLDMYADKLKNANEDLKKRKELYIKGSISGQQQLLQEVLRDAVALLKKDRTDV